MSLSLWYFVVRRREMRVDSLVTVTAQRRYFTQTNLDYRIPSGAGARPTEGTGKVMT
ncbi:MAG: hypothetical protein OJF49_003030 [Ktedonobacterales bacterium]|nr:MAG: hypothetical protein OJF49_003030 [Ktedonobacterales bacterium]